CERAGTAPVCRLEVVGTVTTSATFDRATPSAVEPPAAEPVAKARERSGRCRVNDAGCAIAAVLSTAVAELREVLPVLPAIAGSR
ncbi:MAG TPA: hypothetical protein VFQ40_06235, partial [Actinomycetota bacterium]|nr:hypothetical protein [Actinomycetota bacterium]